MKTHYHERLPDVPAAPVFPPEPPALADTPAEIVSDAARRGPEVERAVDALRDFAPGLADWIADFGFGDILSRPHLDRRAARLAGVAALASLAHARPQLRAHIEAALQAGCSPREILEVILQTAVFAGFPAAIKALETAREVFDARPR